MRIGTVELGKKPEIVLSLDGEKVEEKLETCLRYKVKLVEARGDLIVADGKDLKETLNLIGDYGRYAVFTLRPVWEGGKLRCSESRRLELFKKYVSHPAVGAVDIELRAEKILPDVRNLVKKKGKVLLISYHDFENTPTPTQIKSIFHSAVEKGADIVKMAFYGRTLREVASVCCVMSSFSHPLVFMVMGNLGKLTRVVGFHFGSLLTYTFLGKAVAPGQVPLEELVELIETFYAEW